MMKNTIIRFFVFMVMGTMLIAASRPSIEGRASVAESGELPPGMYIKAHTFLPGDSVIITNPATKVSMEVFVFETIDEGVAAIVSEEVAEKLFITNNSDTLVQIRKVVAHAEIDSSSLEIAEEDIALETPVEEDIVDDSELFIPEIVHEDIPVEVVSLAEPMTEEEVLEEVEVEEEIIEEVEAVSNELPERTDEIVQAEENLETEISEVLEVTEEIVVVEEEIVPETVIEEIIIETAEVAEEVNETDPLVNEITDIIVSTDSEPTTEEKDAIVFTPFADMTALFSGEEIETEENPIEVEDIVTTEPEASDIILEEIPEVAIVAEEPAVDEPIEEVIAVEEIPEVAIVVEEPIVEEEIIEVVEVIVDSPNTLTPTDENPPVIEEVEGIEDEPIVTLYTSPTEEIIEEAIVETETIDIFALTPATEYVEEIPTFTVSMDDFIIDSITIEGAKKYYVQLATYKNEKNILTVLENYSEKYPLSLVESTIIQGAYQVFVGPLTKDEYTVVLERFKTFGYKDAFLKIAN